MSFRYIWTSGWKSWIFATNGMPYWRAYHTWLSQHTSSSRVTVCTCKVVTKKQNACCYYMYSRSSDSYYLKTVSSLHTAIPPFLLVVRIKVPPPSSSLVSPRLLQLLLDTGNLSFKLTQQLILNRKNQRLHHCPQHPKINHLLM